jgi:hypothetical protein
MVTTSGRTPVCSTPQRRPVRPEPGDHLVGDQERAQLVGQRARRGQELGRRDHVPGRALHRLDDHRRYRARRGGLDLLAADLGAGDAAARVAEAHRAAVAVGVRDLVRARRHRSQLVLERRPHQRQHAQRLAVEAAPVRHHLVLAGGALGQPERALDRLGAARVELQPVHARRRRVRRQALGQIDPGARGERPDGDLGRLLHQRVDEHRVRVPESADVDAADEVEVRVAVDVGDSAPPPLLDDDAGHDRVALQAGRGVGVLARAQGPALGAGDGGADGRALVLGL